MPTKFLEKQQWMSGQAVADFLDSFFRDRGWQIEPTTPHEERVLCLGDRHYRKGTLHPLIEYKSGIQTYYTKNVFLETMSVDTQNKLGWVYTCRADYIFYATLLNGFILVMQPDKLRREIEYLKTRFREVRTGKGQNDGYNTHGIIVPFDYAKENLTTQIISVPKVNP